LLGSVEKGVSVYIWTAEEDLFQKRMRPADSPGTCKISRSAQYLKLTWQATDSSLYRSRSLSHWIGPAEGTPPQPMQTDQNDLMVSYYVSERNGSTEVIQARKGIDWNLPDNFG